MLHMDITYNLRLDSRDVLLLTLYLMDLGINIPKINEM